MKIFDQSWNDENYWEFSTLINEFIRARPYFEMDPSEAKNNLIKSAFLELNKNKNMKVGNISKVDDLKLVH